MSEVSGGTKTTMGSRERTPRCVQTSPVDGCSTRVFRCRCPMAVSDADSPGHAEMTAYLEAYAEDNCLRQFIRFRTTIERIERGRDGTWCLHVSDGSVRSYRAVVVAVGVFWCPRLPEYPG